MIKQKGFKKFFVLYCLFCFRAEAGFFEENKTGWHWYQAPLKILELDTKEEASSSGQEKTNSTAIINHYKKELENRLHVAWVNPSFKNIQAYQTLQKEILDKAQDFSQMWMKVIYHVPELDHTLIAPVNHKARHLYFDEKQKQVTQAIQSLAKTHGLFFFFDSQCRFCQAFSPIVQLFSKRYHWEVVPISLEGSPLKEFPRPVRDNGIINKWGIDRFPALFAVNPNRNQVMPIAYGVVSLDELEARILLLIEREGLK